MHADEDSENTRAAYEHIRPHNLSKATLDHRVLTRLYNVVLYIGATCHSDKDDMR